MTSINLTEVARVTQGLLITDGGDGRRLVAGIKADTRAVHPGDLFVALPGPRVDGHDFVAAAARLNAAGAVVSAEWAESPAAALLVRAGFPLVRVEDPVVALGRLSAHHALSLPAVRVGVTGSSGKTTTKEMLALALEPSGPTLKSEASQNGETGVPLALLELNDTHRYAVIEMGMRGAGQIAYLTEIVQPSIGVITSIGRAHIEFLGSVEAIARAKGEMLERLPADGMAIIPADDAHQSLLRSLAPCRVVTFGLSEAADVCARIVDTGISGSRIVLRMPDGSQLPVDLPVPGAHNARNAAAAVAAVWSAGANAAAAAHALASFEAPALRSKVVELACGARLLVDAYNANPDSMDAALIMLRSFPARRVAILGDMLELGAIEREAHEDLGKAAFSATDLLIGIGERSRWTVEAARTAGMSEERVRYFPEVAQAVRDVPGLVRSGDTILIKASRGMQLEQVAGALESGDAR